MLRLIRRSLSARRRRHAIARVTPEWAQARASAGASLLDAESPGWAERVDPTSLELGDGRSCVLGQLHGDYRRGLFRSRVVAASSAPVRFASPVDLGFQASGAGGPESERLDYAFLTRAWREEIAQRTEPTPLAEAASPRQFA